MANLSCPECRSTKLNRFGTKWAWEDGIRVQKQQYQCKHCGRLTIHPMQPQPRNDKGRFVQTKDNLTTTSVADRL